jgi:hypothetical protein
MGVARQFLGVLHHRLTNRGDDFLPSFERHAIHFAERDARRRDGIVHRREDAFAECLARSDYRRAAGRGEGCLRS